MYTTNSNPPFVFNTDGTKKILLKQVVSYLTLISDLDLAPETDQFVASLQDTSIRG